MSLKKKYKVSPKLVADGVWFVMDKNEDGTEAKFRLRRSGRGNRHWMIAYRERTVNVDTDNLSPEEDEVITAEVFVESCVVDWENIQPEDDGVNVPFSKGAALELLSQPEWIELLKALQNKSTGLAEFQDKEIAARVEADAGN